MECPERWEDRLVSLRPEKRNFQKRGVTNWFECNIDELKAAYLIQELEGPLVAFIKTVLRSRGIKYNQTAHLLLIKNM